MGTRIRMGRRLLVATVAVAATLTTGLTASGGAVKANATTPHVANLGTYSFTVNPGTLSNLAEFAGTDMGFFQKFGITPSPINSTSTNVTMQLLETGQLNFASTNLTTTIQAEAATKLPMQVVVGLAKVSPGALVCRTNDGIPSGYTKGIPALAGKTIGLTSPSATNTNTMILALKQFGISLSSVKFDYINGNSLQIAALDAGDIDCAFLSQPGPLLLGNTVVTVLNLLKKGQYPSIAGQAGFPEMTVLSSFSSAHPAVVKAMQKAIIAIDNYLGNRKNASKIATAVANDYVGYSHAQLQNFIVNISAAFKNAGPITRADFAASLKEYNQTAFFTNLSPITNASYSSTVYPQPKS